MKGLWVNQWGTKLSLQWRHNECDGVSSHGRRDYLLNRLFRCKSNKTWKLRVIGICEGNKPVAGEFPVQLACNAENVSIWWRHHGWVHLRWRHFLSKKLWHFHKNIRLCVKNECCCPRTVNLSSINFTWKISDKREYTVCCGLRWHIMTTLSSNAEIT